MKKWGIRKVMKSDIGGNGGNTRMGNETKGPQNRRVLNRLIFFNITSHNMPN